MASDSNFGNLRGFLVQDSDWGCSCLVKIEILWTPCKENIHFASPTQGFMQKYIWLFQTAKGTNASSLSIREMKGTEWNTCAHAELILSIGKEEIITVYRRVSLHLQFSCCSPSSPLPLEADYLKNVKPHFRRTLNASCAVSLPQSQPALESNNSELVISWQNIIFLLTIILSGNWGSAVESAESLTVQAGLDLL